MKVAISFKCTVWQDVEIECSMEDAQKLSMSVSKGEITDIDSIDNSIEVDEIETHMDFETVEFMMPSENDGQYTVIFLTPPFESSNA